MTILSTLYPMVKEFLESDHGKGVTESGDMKTSAITYLQYDSCA